MSALAPEEDRALLPSELASVLERAEATQALLERVTAVFDVVCEVNLQRLPEVVKQEQRNLTYNGGVVEAVMRWARDGLKERLEIRFNLPEDYKRYEYEDKVVAEDGRRQIYHLIRTRQTAILSSGSLRSLAPTDWLLPAMRQGFRDWRLDGSMQMQAAAREGKVLLRAQAQGQSTAAGTTIQCVLDPALNYAVVSWTCPAWGSSAAIEYARDAEGRVVPTQATLRVCDPATGEELRKATLRTRRMVVGAVDPKALTFELRPGMVLADNRFKDKDGKVRLYRVDDAGMLEAIPSGDLPTTESSPSAAVGAAVGVLAVLCVLGLRIRAAFLQQ